MQRNREVRSSSRRLAALRFSFCVLLFAFLPEQFGSKAAKLPDEEVSALKIIANKLAKKDWNFSVDPCTGNEGWNTSAQNSVTCDCSYAKRRMCHVVSIKLKGQNLTGVLPDEMSNLTYLTILDLSPNYLSGTIPTSWASLPLVSLVLSGNRLNGKIPEEIGNITTLKGLGFEANKLEGPLPPQLGNLANLEIWFLNANPLTGELPATLGRLTKITLLSISGSNFTGKIPDYIGSWTQLRYLMLMGTAMEGPIPSSISALKNLTILRISDLNSPESGFPPLQSMQNLQKLILRNCNLSGEIPPYIWNMNKLVELDLSFNSFTGRIPQSAPNPGTVMFLRNNNLTGEVPGWTFLRTNNIDLSENNFTGTAPSSSCQTRDLNLVSSFSSMEDSVPACLRKDYPCSGSAIYSSLFINCGGDEYTIDGNKYEADRSVFGESSHYVSEKGNWALTSTGSFIDVSKDHPYIVTNTSRLMMSNPTLYMSARTSPLAVTYYGLCLQSGSYNVKLHFAEIIFTNDKTFTSLGERVFNVFIQNEQVLQNFNIEEQAGGACKEIIKSFNVSVTRNTLEIKFYWAGKGTISIPERGYYGPLLSAISVTPRNLYYCRCFPSWNSLYIFVADFRPRDFSRAERKPPVTLIVLIVIFGSLIAFLVLVILRIQGYIGGSKINKEFEGLELQIGYFSLKQIKVATRNFHHENKIGEGGFGPVYKGCLSDGTMIAVKQLSSHSKQGSREFLNEIGMISSLQHPNLVKLFGCCIEDRELMLIYEYLENNSLARALFGPMEYRLALDWPTRCKICIGIARGLAYLHEECTLKIVHRDIKATNILLDKDLNAKISDFGLAKLDEVDKTHISTRVAGTIGYMAPEYATRGYLTHKADVFSFGVVILEIVSGQSNAHSMPNEDSAFLLDWACVLQEKGRLLQLVDPSLGTNFSEEEALRMLNVALICSSPSPSLRPTMSSIVAMLEGRTPTNRVPTLSTIISKSASNTAYRFDDPYKFSMTHSSQSSSGFHGGRYELWADSSGSIPNKEPPPDSVSEIFSTDISCDVKQ